MSQIWLPQSLVQSTPGPLRPPPPITASIADISTGSRPQQRRHSQLTAILRQAQALEENLQTLLDAQADGLLAHLDGTAPEAETATTTATASTTLSASYTTAQTSSSRLLSGSKVLPVRQPEQRPLSLRQARKAIWDTMRQLSALKGDESHILSNGIAVRDEDLARIQGWLAKRDGLEKEMATVRESSDSERAKSLRDEDMSLTEEIQKLEVLLQERRSQQRAVRHELQTLENGVQARLSSYRESGRILEREISNFLKSPRSALSGLVELESAVEAGTVHQSYLDLPASRRTLDMAQEYVEGERNTAQTRLEKVSSEREALVEGASLWNDVIADVDGFERLLKKHIKSLTRNDGSSASEAGRDAVLKSMDEVLQSVQGKLSLAETKGWNLLVVAIGAELDAFAQGRDLLRVALLGEDIAHGEHHEVDTDSRASQDTATDDRNFGEEVESPAEPEQPSPVLRSAVIDSPIVTTRPQDHSEDEPDPGLLLS